MILMLFLLYVVGPMARPGARGLKPGLDLSMRIVFQYGPGLDILLRAGPGPGLFKFAGRARAWFAQLLRARAGPRLQIIFADVGLNVRPVQGPMEHHHTKKIPQLARPSHETTLRHHNKTGTEYMTKVKRPK